jgi:Salmonella phage P22 tail-spike
MKRRELTQVLLRSAAGVTLGVESVATPAEGRPYHVRTAPEIASNVVPSNYEFEFGDIRRYGGDPTGASDSSAALQSAVTTGTVLIPTSCKFKILTGATRSGRVTVLGSGSSSQLLGDGPILTITGGTGSVVDNFQMLNLVEPWLISRNHSKWRENVLPTLRRSNEAGYQPTVNDGDLWSGLTNEQKSQQVGPCILFRGDATDIAVSRICGRFVLILLYDTQFSSVTDCNIHGGKGASAAILFWNIDGQMGQFNKALRNTIRYSSFSGIAFARNHDFQAIDNMCVYGGESGIKTWQGSIGGKASQCYRGQIQNNTCKYNYYDGVDAMSDASSNDNFLSYHQIQGNYCQQNGGDGINCNGQFNQITDNHISLNGRFGLWGAGLSRSKISGNFCIDNNQDRSATQHDLSIDGVKAANMISDNFVWAGDGQNNYGIFAPGANITTGNGSGNGSKLMLGKPRV